MKTKIKVILITIFTLLLLVLGLVFAINQRNESIRYFSNSGYIIGNIYDTNGEIETIHFNNESKYKKHSNGEFKITDADGNKVIIEEEMFVHYTDESIMALKKGVAIDLNKIDSKLLKYYNIFSEATLQKNNEGYEIKNIDEVITFDKLMFKLSENKYLVAADNIIAYFSEEQTINFKNFVEIEYVNENVIKIYNNEDNYQSISSNLYLLVDNIKIDLEYKTIQKNNIEYLTMADLNINSNDNIEILPQKPEKIEKEEQENNSNNNIGNNSNDGFSSNSNNNNATGGNSNNNTGNSEQNEIDTSILEGLTPITPNETVKEESTVQPKFTVETFDVTMIGFENLVITMVDEAEILYGDSEVKIIENSTGKEIVKLNDWVDGNSNYVINSYSGLKPDTEYTLLVTGKYEIENTQYDRVYVSKIFRTLDIGLEILGDCATSDSVFFAIYKADYSNVKAITYDIVDSNGKSVLKSSRSKALYSGNVDHVIVHADETNSYGLSSNSEYELVIKSIQYDDDTLLTDVIKSLQLKYRMKTLKQRPDLDVELIADVNLLENELILNIKNINDINKGIKNYTYKIYANNEVPLNERTPAYIVTKDDTSEVVVDIEKYLQQGESYYFNVEIEFDDNEKTIIYNTQFSNPVTTSNLVYPKVVNYVSAENVNCEELVGFLNIDDKDGFIKLNNINEYQVVLREKGSASSTDIADKYITITGSLQGDYITLPVEFYNLKPNTEYVLYTYLKKNEKSIYIGYVTAKTTETDALYLFMENVDTEQSIDSKLFKVNIKLTDSYFEEYDDRMKTIYNYIKNNLGYVTLSLRGCNGNQCIELDSFEKSISSANQSQELTDLLSGKQLLLDSDKFGFYSENYSSGYDEYKLYVQAYSIANYNIPIFINDKKTNYFELKIIDNIPTLEVRANPITNLESSRYDSTLDETTVLGFKLNLKEIKSTKGSGIHDFIYNIYEYNGDCSELAGQILTNPVRADVKELYKINSDEHEIEIYLTETNQETMYRGKNYCLIYQSNYENEKEEISDTSAGIIQLNSLKQSIKIMGYLSKYDANKITFNLKIDDIDSSIKEIYLKNDKGVKSTPIVQDRWENEKLEYSFNVSNLSELTKFGLYINVQEFETQTMTEQLIYEFVLGEIKTIPEFINLKVKDENSKLIFSLDDLGIDLFGLKIIDKTSSNERFVPLTKEEKVEPDESGSNMSESSSTVQYIAEISNSILSDYGIVKDGYNIKLDNIDVKLIYSDGSIDIDNSELIGIKQATFNLNTTLNYYNSYSNRELFENKPLLNSVYYKSNLKSIITGKDLSLNNLEYKNKEQSNNTIGQTLSTNLVHLYKLSLKDLNLETNTVIVDTVLSTTNKVTYTSTGSNIDFTIYDEDIFGTINYAKFILNCDGQEEYVQWILNSDKTDWEYSSGTEHLETVDKKNKNILSVKVKEINEFNSCTYVLKYTKTSIEEAPGEDDDELEEKEFISINSENNKSNEGVVTPLIKLEIDSKKTSYKIDYWKLDGETNDLVFNKILEYDFEIKQNYELGEDEKLYYDLIIVPSNTSENTEIYLSEKNLIEDLSIFDLVDLYEFIADKTLVEGNYKLKVKPYIEKEIENEDAKKYELLYFEYSDNIEIKTRNPEFSIKAYQDVLHLSVNDRDGIFAPWTGESPTSVNLETLSQNFTDVIYNEKKYYLELISSQGDVVAYKPMSFITRSQTINLSELFTGANPILTNNRYSARICYSSILSTTNCIESEPIKLMSSNTLNATIKKLTRSYLVYFNSPDETVKDSIGYIQYTMIENSGEPITLTKGKNDFDYIELVDSNSNSTYLLELELPQGSGLTSDIRQIEVKILDTSGNEITTILYE